MDFLGKKVVIMGLGLYKEGSGISAAKFFISRGAKVTITDLKNKKELQTQITELNKFCKNFQLPASSFQLILGRHRMGDFKTADIVVQNPGARRESPYLLAARSAGAKIVSDISIFFSLSPTENIIGVTGTRGKSTTSALIAAMLKSVDRHTELGGNILRSPLNFLDKIHEGGSAVLELSSWQCESLGEIKKSPRIAVVTNIMRDRLNTYKGMKQYAEAKSLIYKYQSPEDAVVLNRDNAWTQKMGKEVTSRRYWISLKPFGEENGAFLKGKNIFFRDSGKEEAVAGVSDMFLAGEHNLINALAAITVAKLMRVPTSKIKKALKSFKGLPGRIELIRELRGVKFVNDTTATTPDAVAAALKTLGKVKNVVLICGGSDKKLKYKELTPVVRKYVKSLLFLPGTATEKMKKIRKDYQEVKNMKEAVKEAADVAKRGDVVLLSPGAASFGLFQNEFDRGEQFIQSVKKLRG